MDFQKIQVFENAHRLSLHLLCWAKSNEKSCSTLALKGIGVLNSSCKVFMRWQANDFRITVFSNGSSRKWVTSFDLFVLLEQLASLSSDEYTMRKNHHVF